ncbi:excinuclease ABC subunit UvrC [Arachnia propionica]|uniref:UvrABC system protein C n=1 Tax=Arachnia propionica TaxID=1750 RepID=A0A3P1T867_9ACTN|nr:excinuclease ABC subunit UvrC [Arachnia propionica]MDO5084130.1 excinuclease ABC subunit UvrC [Arachnia propionica]RRD05687.1 excinuclease ABC subunit UvrC [Arachnia propionica]
MADPASYRPRPGSIPTEPGVYRFFDAFGNVIYVGKAKNLRSRLNSYFADPASLHFRTQTMVRTAARVEWTVVAGELEALQLEYTWIKQFDPRFNVKYRDDKSYPWLAVTWSDRFPRVFVGRGAKRRGTRYFGPFGQAWAIRETVDALLRVFPMRSCSDGAFKRAQDSGRACLLGDIGKCSAPCVGRVGPEQHRELAEGFCRFMAGDSERIVAELEQEMLTASAELNFERAAVLRDQLAGLTKARERSTVVLADDAVCDVVGFADDGQQVAVQIFHVRAGRIAGERGWIADRADDRDLAELLEPFLLQLYDGENLPPPLVLSSVPAEPELVAVLEQLRGARVEVRVPVRGDKRTLLDTVLRNAQLALEQQATKRASDLTTRNAALEEIAEALGLPEPPLRIECFDISHTQGVEVVGSMVVFEDGLPKKSDYRRFIIKSFEGSDDLRAMDEVLTRRLGRLLDERGRGDDVDGPLLIDPTTGAPRRFAYAPALIVVDGGAPQVLAAAKVLAELGLGGEIALCGLAKRLEEVWLPGEEYPVILPRASEGLYLLQRLRDEAHRFAITHHRGRRSKHMLASALDQVPGLGEMRRKALVTHFGSIKKLREASVEEIATVPGFGPKLAATVHQAVAGTAGEAINLTTGEVTET